MQGDFYPVATRSEAWICGRSLAGIVASNPAGGIDVCLLCMLYVVRQRSLRRADHSSRGVLPNMICLSVIVNPRRGNPWYGIGSKRHRKRERDAEGLLSLWSRECYLHKTPLKALSLLYVRPGLRFRNSILYSQYTFMSCVWMWTNSATFFAMRH